MKITRSMGFSLGVLIASFLLYIVHFVYKALPVPHPKEVTSLLMGIALIGMIISTACFFMNMGLLQMKERKRYIPWMMFSLIAFVLYLAYIGLCLIERAREYGISF